MKNRIGFILFLFLWQHINAQSWQNVDGGVIWGNNDLAVLGVDVMTTDTIHHYLYVGGGFDSAGHKPIQNLARWNGVTWSSVCNINDTTPVVAMCMYGRNLVIGLNTGTIKIVDSIGSIVDSFLANSIVNALVVYNGELYAGGSFYQINGLNANAIARYNGSNWETVDSGMEAPDNEPEIWALCVWNDKLYAAGTFNQAGDSLANNIASWNDTLWKPLGSGTNTVGTGGYNDGYVLSMGAYNNNLYIGGDFNLAGSVASNWLARWNGTNWDSVGEGINSVPYAFQSFQNNLYIAGSFDSAGSIEALGVVSWNDTIFSPLGKGITYGGYPFAIDTLKGELYFGGDFDSAGNSSGDIAVNNIAVWVPDTATGVARISTTNSIVKVYPNPALKQLIFNSSQPMEQLQIENVLGQTLVDKVFDYALQKQTLDVSMLPPGFYFYLMTGANSQIVTGKFVKE